MNFYLQISMKYYINISNLIKFFILAHLKVIFKYKIIKYRIQIIKNYFFYLKFIIKINKQYFSKMLFFKIKKIYYKFIKLLVKLIINSIKQKIYNIFMTNKLNFCKKNSYKIKLRMKLNK